MRRTRLILLLSWLPLAVAHADRLVLIDGSTLRGHFVRQSTDAIVFRVDGSRDATRFDLGRISRLILETERPNADASPTLGFVSPFEPRVQAYREARELMADGRDLDALRVLQRLVTDSAPDALRSVERYASFVEGRSLAIILADARVRFALRDPDHPKFHQATPTRYEAVAYDRRLRDMSREIMSRSFGGRDLLDWLLLPETAAPPPAVARELARWTRLFGTLARHRLRVARLLNLPADEARQLARWRSSAARLAARLAELPGFTGSGSTTNDKDPILEWMRENALRSMGLE